MAALTEIVACADTLLDVRRFQDYCPNGLQIEGVSEVGRIVSGVTASQRLIDAAVEREANLLLVHHGYFWRGEDPRLVGMKGRRIATLFNNGISLLAYHLPLDAHPELGNNVRLAAEWGLTVEGRFGPSDAALHGTLPEEMEGARLAQWLAERCGRPPLHIQGGGGAIRRIGWCSGAAQDYIEEAAALGLDAYLSGEISERTVHAARELGIHYFAAGHHATERFGVRALGEELARRFGIEHHFIDIPVPV